MKLCAIVGYKNSGKTGLVTRLVADLTARGLRVSTLKHAHHAFDIDRPGKDSYLHRQAGAAEVLVASDARWALMAETPDDPPPLATLLEKLAPVDLVLLEGFKTADVPKIEAHRVATGHPLLAEQDTRILAVASDAPLAGLDCPRLDLDDTRGIADVILAELGMRGTGAPALPQDVDWTPVDDALERLREGLVVPVPAPEEILVADAAGRVLAAEAIAVRANPPAANSAVDGYGLSLAGERPAVWALEPGQAAPGAPFAGAVGPGRAVRIFTGALLPDGVDTVVPQELAELPEARVRFTKLPRPGANTRAAGEDLPAGAAALPAGRRLTPPDVALLTALGLARVPVRPRLRVGVLSTGDELAAPGTTLDPARTYDANRPMLLALAQRWGHLPVDLGHAADDRDALRDVLDRGAAEADVMLSSGGASAGDTDHVSALLGTEGRLRTWRVAMKPGRPLALGHWRAVPIFGLPGNPVAALVCALVFARPALELLSGAGWTRPQGFTVPAGFEKRKRAGRREYLRARIGADGRAEVFPSEGSGRISGLSWAEGLVELPDDALTVRPGDPVRYVPFGSFGL